MKLIRHNGKLYAVRKNASKKVWVNIFFEGGIPDVVTVYRHITAAETDFRVKAKSVKAQVQDSVGHDLYYDAGDGDEGRMMEADLVG